MKQLYLTFLCTALTVMAWAQAGRNLVQAVSSGTWDSYATWNGPSPTSYDSVVIPKGIHVDFGATMGAAETIRSYTNMTIDIFGTLLINRAGLSGGLNRLNLNYTAAAPTVPAIRIFDENAAVAEGASTNPGKGRIYVFTGATVVSETTDPMGGVNNTVYNSNGIPPTIIGPAQVYQTEVPPNGPDKQQGFSIGLTSLPMVLVSFDAVLQTNGVMLQWKTQQEQNTRTFLIQRSMDGANFSTIGKVAATGYSSIPVGYTYFDASLSNAHVYYRLRVVDQDGLSSFTSVRVVRGMDRAATLQLYPNPATTMVQLVLEKPAAKVGLLKLLDPSGVQVLQQQVAAGDATLLLPLRGVKPGHYWIELLLEQGTSVRRPLVVVQ